MKYVSAVVGVAVLAVAVGAEFGYYVPKAFYKIDENGYRSPLTYIDNLRSIFHRAKRSAQLEGVNFGFPLQFPQFPQIPTNGQGNFHGVQSSITSNGGSTSGLNSRFDTDGPKVQSTFTSLSNNNGEITETTHFVDKDGKVTTHRKHSKLGSQSQQNKPASSSSSSNPPKKSRK
ncbi:uncharacterized protein LOC129770186 [Toxorhynchites rutilus septentrionalis]|uniref:uncharacterized protein LOC129770186 n=1 Tax=Toxorhynchites rutilus septentrionalis TaxID=329112 RepID=UPI00247ABE8E|nr:uncharacterized protein LOC129770186 [Toxorhynchites rutilus septentrionalis]